MKRRIIAVTAVLLAALSFYFAYRYYTSAYLPVKKIIAEDDSQNELIGTLRPDEAHTVTIIENESSSSDKTKETQSDPLTKVKTRNGDAVGWIYIPDTKIDHPIMQYSDNDFYLHNGVDGNYNGELGCPFLDYRCESDFSGFNSIVYAHNILEERMFANIALFSDESFFKSHRSGVLTLSDGGHEVEFIAYLNVPATSPIYHTVFITDNDRNDYIDYIFSAAKIKSEIKPDELKGEDDLHLIVLSTCTFEYDEARGALVGIIK